MSRRNAKGRDINGIILLDKDTGLSSNAALQKVKRLFFAKKAGHTGALDPLASGILPICLGQATKVAGFLLNDDKRYFVRGQLGQTTDTLDCEGEITAIKNFEQISEAQVLDTALSFQGDIEQVPPMYSALKKDGQPLYKLARQGIEIERKARSVTIHKLDFLGYENGIISLEVSCSKGTYIRSLIADIGEKLGCGAHVIELRRTGFAHIDITQAIKFADLETLIGDTDADFEQLDAKIFPSEAMLPSIHSVTIDKQQSIDIRYGRKIKIENQADNLVKMFDENTIFLGIGQIENGYLQPKRLFI
ncbi:tRNA pseudouridine(55) synthase (EC 5.4.99.25) [uncultured Gammaproteobacteria bacterium]|nr:tRNA pseudouridine(55) synthase (EC [Bathymodiolus brooksi thiotrophic gill symbiont]CAC9536908.1 tRNA pseudouridine(55) synthase (EC 5.4.99.25) [uncultured Gammaproteobacteria bacterium]CAC9540614.1 tRNA pseudouridine(55) synthase (EC 5.4.99.25) [uncultured Gammaproteobacteria bacterium]CAC9551171.1 tRNA pseudouridine(55) synthase (EC 5.4.99.25) [uncultured Gammaproteobacteria bacterium]SHE21537.1 tRNA pseudouridine synthase B [Bathymodiolus brooksi thiotrophic gill symbiont]